MTYFAGKTIKRINEANQDLVAVKIAKICVENKIPFDIISERLNVSKATIYSWFTGKTRPIPSLELKLEELLIKLTEQMAETIPPVPAGDKE